MASLPGLQGISGASGRRAALREGLLFAAGGLLPAVLAVALGLRAVRNEEAAIRREAARETEATARRIEGSIAAEISEAEGRLAALPQGAIPAQATARRALTRSLVPRWAEPALLDARLEPVAEDRGADRPSPREAPAREVPRQATSATCRVAAASLATRDRSVREVLAGCDKARSELGRWLLPMATLGVLQERDDPEAAAMLLGWLSSGAARLEGAERVVTREEIEASRLGEPDRTRALALLATGGDVPSILAEALRTETARAALARGPDGRGLVTWRGGGTLGVVRTTPEGGALGFVVDATALANAVAARAPHPSDTTIRVIASEPPSREGRPRALVWLAPGLGLEAAFADPEQLAARTRRARLWLWVIAGSSAAIALGLAVVLFARVRAARRTSELRTSFAAAVSHELRTPIASIRMLAELLEEDRAGDASERKETIAAIARESRRLGETVSRLLTWSRMSAGRTTASRQPAALAEVVGDVLDVFLERHPDVAIERELDPDLTLAIDAAQVQLATMNLLENARLHAPDGGPYRVTVARTPRGASIEVADRGPGVARALRARIFEPFERGDDRLSKATEGTGIGLALVRAVARAHGGEASVLAAPGGGARFVIELADRKKEEP